MAAFEKEPFPVRFGLENGPIISNEFPDTARIGLWHILHRIIRSGRISGWADVADEVLRLRRTRVDLDNQDIPEIVAEHLEELDWKRVYIFSERVYAVLLCPEVEHDINGEPYTIVGIEDVRAAFEEDLNQLFGEEGIVYRMTDGILHRPGRLHSQKVSAKANVVLRDPRLREARAHYAKAQRFFSDVQNADYANAVKEAVAALEAAIKSLFPENSKEFEKCLKQIQDAAGDPIPPTVLKGIASVYQFRGSGQGIAHGGANGGKPTAAVAEWSMALVASSIIYLRDLANEDDETPPF